MAAENNPTGKKAVNTGVTGVRRARRRRRWIILGVVAALLVAFYCFVTLRGPSDYTGALAQLLPARTSAFIALNDFDGIRQHLAETRLYAELSESVDLAALLMTSEDWREYQENKDSVEWKAKAALAREFLRRYFSHRVVVALARLDGCDEAALLVLARTELGFVEKLAELVAELYPDLHLVTERYRGIPLYAYDGEESKRSFTFVRFGQTVVLSLRAKDREYLRRIIDYRLDAPAQTLFATEDFQAAWTSSARRRGLLAFARPQPLLADLLSRPDFKIRKRLSEARRARLARELGWVRYMRAAVTAEEGIETRILLHREEGTSAPLWRPPPETPLSLIDTVPTRCLAFAVLRFGNLADTLARILNVHRAWNEEADDPAALAAAVERLNALLGIDVNRDLAPAFGHEASVVVHDVQLPMIIVSSILVRATDREKAKAAMERLMRIHRDRYADPDKAWLVPETFRQTPDFQPIDSTPVGFLGAAWLGDYGLMGLNPNAYVATKQRLDGTTEPITSNPVFLTLGLPVETPLDAVAFVNLEEIGRRAQGILAVLAVASKSVRKRSAKYFKIVRVIRLLRGVGLYASHTDDEWTVVVKVPTQ